MYCTKSGDILDPVKVEKDRLSELLMMARLLSAMASLHVDENEAHNWVVGCWDVSVAFCHVKMEG